MQICFELLVSFDLFIVDQEAPYVMLASAEMPVPELSSLSLDQKAVDLVTCSSSLGR